MIVAKTFSVTICHRCESSHFHVRWVKDAATWQIACEGCGAIYNLQSNGALEIVDLGIPQ